MPDEGLVLDGLNLNGAGLVVESGDFTPPAKRLEWSNGADADGALLVRDPLVENRVIKLTMRVLPAATMQAAAARILEISKKLEECEQNPGGLPLVWTPADGTVAALTFYVLTGSVTELPISQVGDSGYFVKAPMLTVELTCKPFGYGAEVAVTAVTSTEPLVTLTLPAIPGDVPAEGRLVVTDGATQNRRTVEWGLEQRYYNAATALILDSDSLVTTGFSGTQTTRAGAYDPGAVGNNVIRSTLLGIPAAVCGFGPQSHVGQFRVQARVYATGINVRVRLAWQDGDGPFSTNAYQTPPAVGAFSQVDLGIVSIAPAAAGTQTWNGRIEAMSTTTTDTIDVDYVQLVPVAEGYGRASASNADAAGVVVAYDDYVGTTPGAALNARAAPAGGSWATSGDATDFSFVATGGYDNGAQITRASGADAADGRFGILGTTNYASVEVNSFFKSSGAATRPATEQGVIARWTNASNHLRAKVRFETNASTVFSVEQVVAGVKTTIASALVENTPGTMYALRLRVYASGQIVAHVLSGGSRIQSIGGFATSAAPGGALATGMVGLRDFTAGSGVSRFYDFFNVSTPPAEPIVVYSGRLIEFRSDGSAIRQDAAGTRYGQAPAYRGSRFLVPPAGDKNRTSRIAVSAARNDLASAAAEPIGDSLSVSAFYTPRYIVVRA